MNDQRLSVSLVIPAYNEERHLRVCLDSVQKQIYQPDEVLVVDNNSTDKTAEVAKTYSFVHLINESRQGRVFARNAGFEAAKGELIVRVDADTQMPADWLEHIVKFYSQADHQKLAFTGDAAFDNVRLPRAVAWLYHFMAFDLNRLFIGHPTLWGSNMALTRKQWQAFKDHVCLRNDIHEDLDLSIHLHDAGVNIFYDRHCRVRANLRRVYSNRHELWDYLNWWPRTLKIHHEKTWPICWLSGVLLLYSLSMVLVMTDHTARLLGRRPLAKS
ncbi:MAG TPA: glycosyltransferase family 2 protein [Candidatus Binatia bacterium]|nr:glycosyltransferase family 2 protein [Candidatus Binatia bacterium]